MINKFLQSLIYVSALVFLSMSVGSALAKDNIGREYYTKGTEFHESGSHLKALEQFEKACGQNNAPACTQLGNIYYYGHEYGYDMVKPDHKKALAYYKKSCNLADILINEQNGCSKYIIMKETGLAQKVMEAYGSSEDGDM